MGTRTGLGEGKVLALLIVLSTLVFGYAVGTRPSATAENVFGVSDSFNFQDAFGGNSKAPSWLGIVEVLVYHNGMLVYHSVQHNTITNVGEGIISACTGRSATGAPGCTNGGVYIALSTDTTATSATDTSCPSEQATNGLARALGTYSTPSATSHKIANVFTYTGSAPVAIAKVCMFDASSGGNLFADDVLSSTATVSANGDQITINWSFTH